MELKVQVIHLDKVKVVHLVQVVDFTVDMLVKRFMWGVKKVSKESFEKSVRKLISDKEVAVLSFYNTIASASKNIVTTNTFTVKELKKLGFKWSRIGIFYLRKANKIH